MAREANGSQSQARNDPTGITPDATFTAGFYFYRDSMTGGQGVFAIGDPDNDSARGFSVFSRANGTIEVRCESGVAIQSTTGVISATTWYKVGVSYNGSVVRLIVDGTQVASAGGLTIGAIMTGDDIAFATPCTAIADSGLDGRYAGAFYLQGVDLTAGGTTPGVIDDYLDDLCSLITDYGVSGGVTADALKALYLFQSASPGEDISGVGNDLTNDGTTDVADPTGIPTSCGGGGGGALFRPYFI